MDLAIDKCPREDDTLEAFLYPQFSYTLEPDHVTEEMLKEECDKYQKEINQFIQNYFWHRDCLTFQPKTKQFLQFENINHSTPKQSELALTPHIYISLRFDEDIGDEWFIVFLIFHLTKVFKGLIAQITDSDGEFLLIEAANELPTWATPETCQDKVFIINNEIHIVYRKQNIHANILRTVYQSNIYKMSEKVQNSIYKRLSIYPDEITKRLHKARAYLPEKAAAILKKEPCLISTAIRAICHSDPMERKVCRAMKYFPPEERKMVNVKMTKVLYSMCTCCKYTGDPKTGWSLPPKNSSQYKAHLLGVKIACGFEILLDRAHKQRRKKIKSIEILENPQIDYSSQTWLTFFKSLSSNNYFKGLYEDSKEYKNLLHEAEQFYIKYVGNSKVGDEQSDELEKVLETWEDIQSNDLEFEGENILSPEDNDAWLELDHQQFETFLSQKFESNENKSITDQPLKIHEKMQAFLNKSSDIEGVELYGENAQEIQCEKKDSEQLEFDSDAFGSKLQEILEFIIPGEDGEFDGSSEDSLGDEDEEISKYMKLMDSQLQKVLVTDKKEDIQSQNNSEINLRQSLFEEAGGSGPVGNILGGPLEKLKHLEIDNNKN